MDEIENNGQISVADDIWDGMGDNGPNAQPEEAPQPIPFQQEPEQPQTETQEQPQQNDVVSRAEYEALQRQHEKFKQDAMRAIGVDTPAQQPGIDPNDWAQTLLSPEQMQQKIRMEAQAVIQQERAQQELEKSYEQKYQDMVPFKPYVFADAQAIWQQHAAMGKPLTDDQAVEMAVTQFRQKLGGNTAVAENRRAGQEVMRLDVKGQPQNGGSKLTAEQIYRMPQEQFAAYDGQVQREMRKRQDYK